MPLVVIEPGLLLLLTTAPPWPVGEGVDPLSVRLAPPDGYARTEVEADSFGAWLRRLPVKPGRPAVHLFDGRKKANQAAHYLVLDVDVGKKDLQQCADAVMRLFAEWQREQKLDARICFRFTSGDALRWSKWAAGYRPRVRGSKVTITKRARTDRSYRAFRTYLDAVFTFAGTHSLSRDLPKVPASEPIEPGDVFIQGGFPGHAVLVVDVVQNGEGARRFALVQSFMPAQQIHVLRNRRGEGPWYRREEDGKLKTPEWTFEWTDRRRFGRSGCPGR